MKRWKIFLRLIDERLAAGQEGLYNHKAKGEMDRWGARQVSTGSQAIRKGLEEIEVAFYPPGASGPGLKFVSLCVSSSAHSQSDYTTISQCGFAEHIGTKTAVQIRSHAQSSSAKLQREQSQSGAAGEGEKHLWIITQPPSCHQHFL